MTPPATVFHVDMDAFYTSIEQRDNPDLKGKPVIVGSKPGTRGVVSAASYEARKFGVYSATPINEAYKKCPHGIYLKPRMSHYLEVSKSLMEIFLSFTPEVEPLSVDEAFLNMTGTEKLWGPFRESAVQIQKIVLKELALTCSIGVAPNKFLAKVASDMNKPHGITYVPFEARDIANWLAPLAIRKIWGIGKVTQSKMQQLGIEIVKDLQQADSFTLKKYFGKHGSDIYHLARGIDNRTFGNHEISKSISREHTFSNDSSDIQEWHKILLSLSRDVAERTRQAGLKGETVVFTWRKTDFSRHSKRTKLEGPTQSAQKLFSVACELLAQSAIKGLKIRLIGVGLTGFHHSAQTSLLDSLDESRDWKKSEEAMDVVVKKYGGDAIKFGGEMDK